MSAPGQWRRRATLVGAVALLAGCVFLTTDPRAVIDEPEGLRIATLQCAHALAAAASAHATPRGSAAVDPAAIRMLV